MKAPPVQVFGVFFQCPVRAVVSKLITLVVVWLALSSTISVAQTVSKQSAAGKPPEFFQPHKSEQDGKQFRYPKLDSLLRERVSEYEAQGQSILGQVRQMVTPSPRVRISVQVDKAANVDAIARFLEDNGASSLHIWETSDDDVIKGLISADVPVSLLVRLSQQPDVLVVWEEVPPKLLQSRTPEQAHNATQWHTAGFEGSNVRVGVIDGGFEGFDSRRLTTQPVRALCWRSSYFGGRRKTFNISDCRNVTDHGTDVSNTLLGIAPKVSLYISNPYNYSELKEAVDWMIRAC